MLNYYKWGDSMKPVLLTPMLYGKYCSVRFPNGKEYRRVVRYSKADGLFVVIAKTKYIERDMTIREETLYGKGEDDF